MSLSFTFVYISTTSSFHRSDRFRLSSLFIFQCQTNRQTDKQSDKQTDKQTHKQTKQTDKQTDNQTDRQTDTQTNRQTNKQTDKQRDKQTDKQTHKDNNGRKTDRHKQNASFIQYTDNCSLLPTQKNSMTQTH